MTEGATRRKLAAILSADAVGYSRLMGADEAATVETLKQYRGVIARIVERHGGRVVNAPGDAVLAEFPSAIEAVQAAVEVQKGLEGRNVELAPERRMQFRIGVNLGDVIEDSDGSIYGDGVNIAARMEALAEPGGVCASSTVFDAVEGKLAAGFDFLGEQQVKNIAKPVRVYRVRAEARPVPSARARSKRRLSVSAAVAALGVVVVAGGAWLARDFVVPPRSTGATAPPTTQTAAPQDPSLALPKGPAIAVLPFANLTGDLEQEHFSDGFTEELISKLSRFQDLRVIARQSTLQYKSRSVDVRQIGRDLGIQFVVEGSVRREPKRIRVTAQLIDARDGAHLWSDTYDRALAVKSLLAVQDDIASQIVATLGDSYGIITRSLAKESTMRLPDDLSIYACAHLYYDYTIVNTIDTLRRAIGCLEGAVRKYPDYADAWGFLAELYAEDHASGFDTVPDALARALEAGTRAVKTDPHNQRARWGLAYAHLLRHERRPFQEEAERALALNPNRGSLVSMIGWGLCLSGDWKKEEWNRGLALIDKGAQLNPYGPSWVLFPVAVDRYMAADYKGALEVAEKIDMPDYFYDPMLRAAILGQLGRLDEARAALGEALRQRPDLPTKGRALWLNYYHDARVVDRLFDGLQKAGLNVS